MSNTEDNAKAWFLKGIECERDGNHYEATRYYRRAFRLDSDIEDKITDDDLVGLRDDNSSKESDSDNDYDIEENLYIRFQKMIGPQICFPEYNQQTTHFSALPTELILYIFRWVVSSDLDLRTLEICSSVCRGWYMYARDSELWRRACLRVWNKLNIDNLASVDGSWRRLFIEYPHVLTIGCYICKISYVRQGEEAFQDLSYGPSFNVVYYRYLRFFSDGHVFMIVSSSEPAKIVQKLKSKALAPPDVCYGFYHLSDNKLSLKLDSRVGKIEQNNKLRRKVENVQRKTTYYMSLEILKHKSKHNCKLVWRNYEIVHRNRVNKLMTTKYDLSNNRFPPFIYSRVKSYTTESENVL
ncbi:F-box only protein 9 [Daktulosphaira vitifoliae]|uniref:F-box only protein 9 n=1 Tax=Daktulosphaira vitifoliae TaxID=58002 RepID=UPI0021AA7DD6|nr:F-box only protein 9 [Daktulosphaira vitifoliae]